MCEQEGDVRDEASGLRYVTGSMRSSLVSLLKIDAASWTPPQRLDEYGFVLRYQTSTLKNSTSS
jgi:hypothetical protein